MDLKYWQKTLKEYSDNTNASRQDPAEFYYTSNTFKQKKRLDRGEFD